MRGSPHAQKGRCKLDQGTSALTEGMAILFGGVAPHLPAGIFSPRAGRRDVVRRLVSLMGKARLSPLPAGGERVRVRGNPQAQRVVEKLDQGTAALTEGTAVCLAA
ncbi:hypothetical protein ASG03_00770 [Rhizobium sp. Leaf341]|nr:hypothetical protein ASG03_00770 [Rhizobium sp. Leaf341]